MGTSSFASTGVEKFVSDMKLIVIALFLVASVTSEDKVFGMRSSDLCGTAEALVAAVNEAKENGEVVEEGKLFEFMKNKWDADGNECFSGTEFGKMWSDLEIDVNSASIYSYMDKDKNDCISDKEWMTTIGIIRKACVELTSN